MMSTTPIQDLRTFTKNRLITLGRSATDAERRGGLAKGFIGDILRGRKTSVQSRKLAQLARALDLELAEILSVLEPETAAASTSSAWQKFDRSAEPDSDDPQTKAEPQARPIALFVLIVG